ncbi:ABC transporter ATP-binding protein [Caproicibacter sp.]|uniref:ABC transporter ATP-binding protein n=1 Tax=Caproicibacter sp. TaxID=2814884 RepID=UPI0039899E3C
MKLELLSVACGYGGKNVLSGISFSVSSGEILCILGPNGVGKTTLFKSVLGFLNLRGGEIRADGENVSGWSRRRFARSVGYVPQAHNTPFPFTVFDVVLMGRTAYFGTFSTPDEQDRKIVERVLEALEIDCLRDRRFTELSGGERQMVLIARALAQKPKILVMDEPTSNLDFGNQIRVLRRIKKLSQSGLGVVMTSHFPDHAFLCSSRVALLRRGGLQIGAPDTIVTEKNLQDIYGVSVKIAEVSIGNGIGVKTCVPLIN